MKINISDKYLYLGDNLIKQDISFLLSLIKSQDGLETE
jgi:hypothetical protein